MRISYSVATAGFVLTFLVAGSGLTPANAQSNYEFWPNCNALPPLADLQPLPIFLPMETPSFVDLGSLTQTHAGESWKALQWTRDKDFGTVPVEVGKWVIGAGGDEWPANTVDVKKEMFATRVVAWEIDGKTFNVNPSCFLDLSSSEGTFGLYNIWVRFNAPGTHTLRIFLRQIRDFYFVFHGDLGPIVDPGNGRWVFLAGEIVGNTLDGLMVHPYTLDVQP